MAAQREDLAVEGAETLGPELGISELKAALDRRPHVTIPDAIKAQIPSFFRNAGKEILQDEELQSMLMAVVLFQKGILLARTTHDTFYGLAEKLEEGDDVKPDTALADIDWANAIGDKAFATCILVVHRHNGGWLVLASCTQRDYLNWSQSTPTGGGPLFCITYGHPYKDGIAPSDYRAVQQDLVRQLTEGCPGWGVGPLANMFGGARTTDAAEVNRRLASLFGPETAGRLQYDTVSREAYYDHPQGNMSLAYALFVALVYIRSGAIVGPDSPLSFLEPYAYMTELYGKTLGWGERQRAEWTQTIPSIYDSPSPQYD